jgi:hypothetical protein
MNDKPDYTKLIKERRQGKQKDLVGKMVSPIVAPSNPWGHDFNKLDSALCEEDSM